jgi:hypothetical protein
MNPEMQAMILEYKINSKKNKYESDTDNEDVYIDIKNAKFGSWKEERQKKHVIALWRKAYNMGYGANTMINL